MSASVNWHNGLTGADIAQLGERDPEVIAHHAIRIYDEGPESFVALHLRTGSNITIECGSLKDATHRADILRRELVNMLVAFSRNV